MFRDEFQSYTMHGTLQLKSDEDFKVSKIFELVQPTVRRDFFEQLRHIILYCEQYVNHSVDQALGDIDYFIDILELSTLSTVPLTIMYRSNGLHYKRCVRFVPWRARVTSSHPRWVSGYLRHLIGEKKRAYALYESSGMKLGYPEFRALRARCKLISEQLYQGSIDRAQADLRTNIKAFWNFANAGRVERGAPGRIFLDERYAEDRNQTADLLASHFKSVYSSEPTVTAPRLVSGSDVTLASVSVSLAVPARATEFAGLRTLNTNRGPGPNGIPPLLLRSCLPPYYTYYLCSRYSSMFSPAIGSVARLLPCLKRVMELRSRIIDLYT